MHADAYRLGSPAEVDDLDLDADTATSVTVVEWGGGLVEGLAQDWLDVARSRGQDPARPGPPRPRPDPGDEPRALRLAGQGERWAAAAESVHLAITGTAEVL